MYQESGIAVSHGVDRKCGSDPTMLLLWSRQAGTALIQPLARKLPYAAGAALKNKTKQKS